MAKPSASEINSLQYPNFHLSKDEIIEQYKLLPSIARTIDEYNVALKTDPENEELKKKLEQAKGRLFDLKGKETVTVLEQNRSYGRKWFTEEPFTEDTIEEGVNNGDLVPIENDDVLLGYKVNEPSAENKYKWYLRPEAKNVLELLVKEWRGRLKRNLLNQSELSTPKNSYTEDVIDKIMCLILTSAVRTLEHQEELNQESKFPAAPGRESVHTLGWAFDIGPSGMLARQSFKAFGELVDILMEWEKQGFVQVLWESAVNAIHITVNPNFIVEDGKFVSKAG